MTASRRRDEVATLRPSPRLVRPDAWKGVFPSPHAGCRVARSSTGRDNEKNGQTRNRQNLRYPECRAIGRRTEVEMADSRRMAVSAYPGRSAGDAHNVGTGRKQEKPEKPDRPSSEGGEVATPGLTDKPILVPRRPGRIPQMTHFF